eukprot:CAMPEP_0178399406 /NCGR_PEP_ID=MMETSP0689_2-20121128/15264_1 /TAXON_ID=160604 /ORGANISM="Amphidinium massartii, Strain CS-259" /LENGTH=563 /DNA_ID=CAMNT_0020020183 /DNA_START=77 /DNA_END=1768 /DNA_ORIENTATION=-
MMMMVWRSAFSSLFSACCLLLCRGVAAWPNYQNSIPNGAIVMRQGSLWAGVGHLARGGGGPRNEFGAAFAAAGFTWTEELCRADSDGDNQTNGFELGDPDCVWSSGGTPSRTSAISHPGFADTYVDVTTNASVISEEPPTTAGSSTASATASPTPAASSTTASGPGDSSAGPCGPGASDILRTESDTYDCVATVGTTGLQLHWTVTGETTLDFALRRSMAGGYMALAWPGAQSGMNGPSLIVTADGTLGRYTLSPGVASLSSDATVPFPFDSDASTVENGEVVHRIAAADMAGILGDAGFANDVKLLWATADSGGVAYHAARGEATVNFASGASVSSAGGSIEDDVKLHGILQITAWCFMAPLAVFLKRLGARVPAFQKMQVPGVALPLPYVLHALIMLTAIALSLSAVGIAKEKFSAEVDYGHGVTAHIVVVMIVIQPVVAILWQLCKPKPESEHFAKAKLSFSMFHRVLGMSIMLIAAVTVFTGINNYKNIYMDDDQASSYMVTAIVGLVALCSLPVCVEIANRFLQARGGSSEAKAGSSQTASPHAVGKTVESPVNAASK